jgi:hypothetical protein
MNIEDLSEFAVTFLLTGQGTARQLAVRLAERLPQSPPLEVAFLISAAASGIEETFASPEMAQLALESWRAAALLGVDLRMMQQRGLPCASCADLLAYWRRVDGFFLS